MFIGNVFFWTACLVAATVFVTFASTQTNLVNANVSASHLSYAELFVHPLTSHCDEQVDTVLRLSASSSPLSSTFSSVVLSAHTCYAVAFVYSICNRDFYLPLFCLCCSAFLGACTLLSLSLSLALRITSIYLSMKQSIHQLCPVCHIQPAAETLRHRGNSHLFPSPCS